MRHAHTYSTNRTAFLLYPPYGILKCCQLYLGAMRYAYCTLHGFELVWAKVFEFAFLLFLPFWSAEGEG